MSDPINEVLAAPPREMKLSPVDSFANTRKRHRMLVEELAKANEKREEAIARLRRADDKVRSIRAALARSTKRDQQRRDEAFRQEAAGVWPGEE